MFSLLIYENKTSVEISLQRDEDNEETFDATTELFDFYNGYGRLYAYSCKYGTAEHSIIAAKKHISDYENDRVELSDIEIEMGYGNISFPIIAYGENVPIYKCGNIQSVILCVLRFFLANGYKKAKCRHCGRLYVTKNLHIKYCNRYSTYSGYERYVCKDAVKHINDSLEKRRKMVYERLRSKASEYGILSKHSEIFNNYCAKCAEYKAKIKDTASIANLTAYSNYLQNGKDLPKRYERVKEARP